MSDTMSKRQQDGVEAKAAAAMRKLIQHLFTVVKDDGAIYLLLDRYYDWEPELQEAVDGADLAEEQSVALTDSIFGTETERAPLLLRLTSRNLRLLDVAAADAMRAGFDVTQPASAISGWLRCEAEPARLAAHLSRRLQALLPDKTPVLLRYYDPRTLPRLYSLLTDMQRAQLLGPVKSWLMVGREGTLITLRHPQAQIVPAQPLVFEEPQAAAIWRIEAVNIAARRLRTAGHHVSYAEDARLDSSAERGRQRGLTRIEDLGAYAALAFCWPTNRASLEEDSTVQRGIELTAAGLPLADYIEQHVRLS
jgi:hypothetical protein